MDNNFSIFFIKWRYFHIMKRNQCYLIIFSFILAVVLFNNVPQTFANSPKSVLFMTNSNDQRLKERFSLDPKYLIEIRDTLPSNLDLFDVIILIDFVFNSSILSSYEGGLIIFTGSVLTNNATCLVELGLTSTSIGAVINNPALPVVKRGAPSHPLLKKIEWNSIPVITHFSNLPLLGTILVETSSDSINPNLPLISSNNNDKHLMINIWPNETLNSEFVQWPYFNYFLFLLMQITTNQSPMSYADWPYSPVPHLPESLFLGISVLVISIITVGGYQYAKNYARKNPISEKDIQELSKQIVKDQNWEEIGMHRPLGGFMVQFFIGILILLPNVIMSALVFPLLILPSPQAAGFYDFTLHFFEALWLLFDLGTSTALVKFFAEHRIKRPQYAVRFIQIFIWFQMISGIIQLFLISFLGSIIFPRTFLAQMSWVFVTHAFFQWPAFFIVFMLIFQGMNRLDYYQILNLLLYGIFNITIQYLVILIFRLVLGSNIIFGDSLAGAIGYSIGNYVIMWAGFIVGLWFFKHLGFSVKSIFRVDFTFEEIKSTFKFGFKWAIGNLLPPLGWFWQVFLLSAFLPNYTEQQGFFSIAWSFALIVMLVGLFDESILGGISESYHAGRKKLTQYYTASSLKWSAFFDFFFVAALLTIGPKFIIGGAGPEWAGAAILIPWLLLFHAFGYLSWLGDWMFAGSDRPGWAAISWIIEQGIRGVLLLLFIPNWALFSKAFGSPMIAVMFAYIPALIIKDIFMWWGIRRSEFFRFPWRDVIYQGFIAPILSGILIFLFLDRLFNIIWQGDIFTSVIILLIGILGGFYLFSFIYGLLGGFDDNSLSEFYRAVKMARGLSILAILLYKTAKAGTRISPLHNKFPIRIFDSAMEEARTLTKEKEDLVI